MANSLRKAIIATVVNDPDGPISWKDAPAIRQAVNNYVDYLIREGQATEGEAARLNYEKLTKDIQKELRIFQEYEGYGRKTLGKRVARGSQW